MQTNMLTRVLTLIVLFLAITVTEVRAMESNTVTSPEKDSLPAWLDCRNCVSENIDGGWVHCFAGSCGVSFTRTEGEEELLPQVDPRDLEGEESGLLRRCEGDSGCHSAAQENVCS